MQINKPIINAAVQFKISARNRVKKLLRDMDLEGKKNHDESPNCYYDRFIRSAATDASNSSAVSAQSNTIYDSHGNAKRFDEDRDG